MQQLAGRNAFVTGGASGIGLAIARSLARKGVHVAVADIDEAAAKSAAESLGQGAVAIACDVTDAESVERAADAATGALGDIHILVNNAGAFTVSPIEQTSERDWQWLIDINVMGVVRGLRVFLPRMRAHGEPAHIVNTASVSGHIGVGGLGIYTATKFAVVGLSECLRIELADSAIGLSVLCPGIVKTGLLESSVRHRPDRHGGSAALDHSGIAGVIEQGTDPAEVGDAVAAGIERGEFYILTHPSARPPMETRFAEVLGAF